MPQIKAIVFDFDGTLLDSFDFIIRLHHHIAQRFNYPEPSVPEIQARLRVAMPLNDILRDFYPEHSLSELLAALNDFHAEQTHTILPFEGTEELLTALHAQDIRLAILTGGNGKVEDTLRHVGFDDYFVSVVHCDRVQFAKPHPEGFSLGVEECAVLPAETIMVGDSPNDILAGKNGQAAITVGITHGHGSRHDLMAADPDYIVDTVPELTELLLRLTSQPQSVKMTDHGPQRS